MRVIINDFFSGFSVDLESLRVALVYMNAFKAIDEYGVEEGKEVRRALKQLFEQHAVVVGDMNSSPFAIQKELNTLGLQREMHRFPTYLFPAYDLQGSADIPCFDNAIWDKSRISELSAWPLLELPLKVNKNPRDLIKELGLLSDHIPVEVTFSGHNIVAFNVADPLLWSQYYPNSGQGFELTLEAEDTRQRKLLTMVQEYVSKYDVVFLQEVPTTLAEDIKKAYPHAVIINMQSSVELESPSKLVLLEHNQR